MDFAAREHQQELFANGHRSPAFFAVKRGGPERVELFHGLLGEARREDAQDVGWSLLRVESDVVSASLP